MAEAEKREQVDPVNGSESNDQGAATLQEDDFGFTPEQQRRIIRRIDVRLVVTVGLLYCVCLVDRTNMSAANIAGMSKELDLVKNRYASPSFHFRSPTICYRREAHFFPLEHCQPRLLHDVYNLPSPLHDPHPQDWAPGASRPDYAVLGRRHGWHGLC
jgi:hypothetical protein